MLTKFICILRLGIPPGCRPSFHKLDFIFTQVCNILSSWFGNVSFVLEKKMKMWKFRLHYNSMLFVCWWSCRRLNSNLKKKYTTCINEYFYQHKKVTQNNKSIFRFAIVLLADNADASNPDVDVMNLFYDTSKINACALSDRLLEIWYRGIFNVKKACGTSVLWRLL